MRAPSHFLLAFFAVVVGAPAASAADAPPLDLKTARVLFVDAERDEDAGRWQDAEEKLQRVAQVKLTAGIRYHLALCLDHLGHLAQALAGFEAARDQARSENAHDVLRLVGTQLADLNPRVPRVVIHAAAAGADAVVTLDGVPVPSSRLGDPLPVDPGDHRVEATAPGRRPAVATATLHERDAVVIDLPPGELLIPAPAPPPPPVAPPPPVDRAEAAAETPYATQLPRERVAALATTAGAVVLAGFGVGAFLAAGAAHHDGVRDCAGIVASARACDSKRDQVRAWDWAAIGGWSAAALAAAGAIYLWSRPVRVVPAAASRGPEAVRLDVVAGPAWAGVRGSF
jgi:hypothetical protein